MTISLSPQIGLVYLIYLIYLVNICVSLFQDNNNNNNNSNNNNNNNNSDVYFIVLKIRPSYVSIIVFGGKFWDAFTDPMCGFLVSKTNTRFGKFRPW